MNWDAVADEAEMSEWHSFLVDIRSLEQVKIPRPLIPITFTAVDMELYCFSDASDLGYGAVVYARVESDDKQVMCSILMGKSRVSPIKSVTIPRLELTAAVLTARLATQDMEELKLNTKPTFWVDSMVILQPIRSRTKRFTTFTTNRLSAIYQCSSPVQWRYVETSENVADLASRGIRACDERKLDRWFYGPDFLKIPREWLKKDLISVHHCQTASSWFDVFVSCASWTMIRRRIAILIRFKNIC
ncbi:Pao retrotransposon peptidase domain-containing protein [Paragonimus heterotremus]|uniref:Pao retrotransposon peptidase domain-containing protein n=1 Tax=Paragonimus heterotremus TaxID=100268 RepID=A0A8J4WM39_9TREM|nr:Pao retrotransposon peptidase domain-containing protein [Paragonimus heterotremus]